MKLIKMPQQSVKIGREPRKVGNGKNVFWEKKEDIFLRFRDFGGEGGGEGLFGSIGP